MHFFKSTSRRLKPFLPLVIVLGLLMALPPANVTAQAADFKIDGALQDRVDLQDSGAFEERVSRGAGRPLKQGMSGATFRSLAGDGDRAAAIGRALEQHGAAASVEESLVSDDQRRNLRQLIAGSEDAKALQVVFNANNGTPAFVKLKSFERGSRRSARALQSGENPAAAFIRANRKLLKLNNPAQELKLARSWGDDLGAVHFKYQQMAAGLPVFGKQLLVHVDGSDAVYLVNGRYEPSPEDFEAVFDITAAQAVSAALAHLGLQGRDTAADGVEPVVFTMPSGEMVLTYKVRLSLSLSECWIYFIDARSGAVVHRMTDIRSAVITASGTDLNGAGRSFNAWQQGGGYYLIDPSMPSSTIPGDPISELKSPGNTYILTARNGDGENLYHITNSAADSGWDTAGVSAMVNIKTTYDYYKNTFGRRGIDDADKNYMAVVHLENNYNNAFWNGTFVVFGDGDNRTFSNLAAALDITAHEIQHGVTQFSADLKYENQSGALNEAYSDVFACMVDEDWLVGEDCTVASPGYLRNLADPSKGLSALPATMSDYRNLPNTEEGDWGGVHINMSIPSRAGYLMAEGLDDAGLGQSIGRAKTAQIWYRALTTYLSAYSQFADGRRSMIQAAEDLYGSGSAEVAAVQAAWDAVEVYGADGGADEKPEPTPGDVVSGDDVMIYLYPTDGSHDSPYDSSEHYGLYVLLDAENGYAEGRDLSLLDQGVSDNDRPNYTKVAAYTNAQGNTLVFYATEDYDLHDVVLYADGTVSVSEEVLSTKDIYSIALSPDGRYFAYTTPEPDDNNIYVLDLDDDRVGVITLVPPNDAQGSSDPFNTILYADSLSFDYTSKVLVFDALNCISTPESSCADDGGYKYWSMGFVYLESDPDDADRVKGTLAFPFPNQNPDYDIGYPAFAANNNFVVAIDFIDYSADTAVYSMVWTLNGRDGESRQVASPNLGADTSGVWGVPTFWGGDDAVTIQRLNAGSGSVYRVPVDSGWAGPADSRFSGGQSAITSLNDYDAAMPLMHRRAARTVSGKITLSTQNLKFSDVAVASQSTKQLTLSNNSGKDIRIENIAISGSSTFTHNGTNALLPRNESMVITVAYTPANDGSHAATLTITSDADTPTSQVSLTGTTGSDTSDDGGTSGGGGGGGGGCMISLLGADGQMLSGGVAAVLLLVAALLITAVISIRRRS